MFRMLAMAGSQIRRADLVIQEMRLPHIRVDLLGLDHRTLRNGT